MGISGIVTEPLGTKVCQGPGEERHLALLQALHWQASVQVTCHCCCHRKPVLCLGPNRESCTRAIFLSFLEQKKNNVHPDSSKNVFTNSAHKVSQSPGIGIDFIHTRLQDEEAQKGNFLTVYGTLTTSCPERRGWAVGHCPRHLNAQGFLNFFWLFILSGAVHLDFWENSLSPLSRQS